MVVRVLQHLSDWGDRIVRVILVPVGALFIFVVFLGVLARYVFHAPMVTSVELARLGFVWSVFLGAAVTLKNERHTQFTFLLDAVGEGTRRAMLVVIDLLAVAFFGFLVAKGIQMVQAVQDTYFPALGWSQLWLYLPLPLCAAFMFVHVLAFLARDLVALAGRRGTGAAS
jgi:TRAP-type C4-dicarboxylate transport system permease small subunit